MAEGAYFRRSREKRGLSPEINAAIVSLVNGTVEYTQAKAKLTVRFADALVRIIREKLAFCVPEDDKAFNSSVM